MERQHASLKTAPRSLIAHGIQFGLQVTQRAQLLHCGGHKPRVFQNPVGDAHFFRDQSIVVQGERRACARQIVEFATCGGGGNTLFD